MMAAMARTRTRSTPRAAMLGAVDVGALALFVVVGVSTHDHGLPFAAIARVGAPLLAAWLGATGLVGTYRRPGLRSLIAAWGVAVPSAVVVRTAIAGGPWGREFIVFLGVALAFTLLFLVLGRAAVVAARALVPVAG
jgi:hypothetical protein